MTSKDDTQEKLWSRTYYPAKILNKKVPAFAPFGTSLNDQRIYTFLNPYSYLVFRKDLTVFNRFDQIFFDGISLVWLGRLFGIRTTRASFDFTSLASTVFEHCRREGQRVYLVGSTEPDIIKASQTISNAFSPDILAGIHSGYFSDPMEIPMLYTEIAASKASFVIAGMGSGRQERFLLGLIDSGWNGTGFTCGGFFHQTAKKGIEYYPKQLNFLQLRWLYRIIDEPKLFRRYLFDYPKGCFLFAMDQLSLWCRRA